MATTYWKRAASAGVAVSFVLAAIALSTADRGDEVAAFTTTLIVALSVTALVTFFVRRGQQRSSR